VVVGETHSYSFEAITKAIRLIQGGSRFIVTNPDATGPSPEGALPATGAIAALITKATNREPYVVAKPNTMMFRSALKRIGTHSILVVSGISSAEGIRRFPFRPNEIVDGVHELLDVPLEARSELGPDTTGSA